MRYRIEKQLISMLNRRKIPAHSKDNYCCFLDFSCSLVSKRCGRIFESKIKVLAKDEDFYCYASDCDGLHSEEQPDNDVRRNNSGKGERNTDLEEVTVLDRVSFLTQNTDTRDVSGCTDGRAVTAKRCTGQKSEIQGDCNRARIHAHLRRKCQ